MAFVVALLARRQVHCGNHNEVSADGRLNSGITARICLKRRKFGRGRSLRADRMLLGELQLDGRTLAEDRAELAAVHHGDQPVDVDCRWKVHRRLVFLLQVAADELEVGQSQPAGFQAAAAGQSMTPAPDFHHPCDGLESFSEFSFERFIELVLECIVVVRLGNLHAICRYIICRVESSQVKFS